MGERGQSHLKADCHYSVPLILSPGVSDIEVLCGQTVDGVLFEILGLVETKSNVYLYHRVMLVIQIALTLEELLEDEAVAGLTSGCRCDQLRHRSLDGTCETRGELSAGESSVQTVTCRPLLVVRTYGLGPVSGGDNRLWTRYPSGIDLLWYKGL